MKPLANFPIPTELEALDCALEEALRTGDGSKLVLLGYGEISCVLQFDRDNESFACKRLPIFQDEAATAAYAQVFDDYLRFLEERGVTPTPSRLVTLEGPGPCRRVYCVQHKLESASLLPKWLATATDADAARIFGDIVNLVENVAKGDPKPQIFNLGIDGQASNWALVDGKLVYLDVTTPLLRDKQGAERLNMDLFLASLPWGLRFVVKKLMLRGILDKYYVPRGIVLDFLGNLIKEKLEAKIPLFLDILGDRFTPRLSEKEIRAYYDDDANTWALLQRLRRMDRTWQNKIRRRVYPFLLPGPISR
jgi:Family of unknown function (DUF6206)